MDTIINLEHLAGSIVFSMVGFLLLAIAYFIVEKTAPNVLKRELIDEHNTALAVVIGSLVLGLSIIIASAIHG